MIDAAMVTLSCTSTRQSALGVSRAR
jgi:hypothetical protein